MAIRPIFPPDIIITAVDDDDARPSFPPYPAPSIHHMTTIEHSPPFSIAGNPTVVSTYPHEATTMFHCASNAYLPSHLIPSPCHHHVSVEWHISGVWEYEAAHCVHAGPRQRSSSPLTISPPPHTVPFESLRMSHVTKGAFIFVKWPCVTRLKGLIRQDLVSQTQKGAKFDEKWLKIEKIFQLYLISCLFLVVPWLEYSSKLYFNSNIIRILYEYHCHWPRIRSFGKVQICRMSQAIRSDSNGTVLPIFGFCVVAQPRFWHCFSHSDEEGPSEGFHAWLCPLPHTLGPLLSIPPK